MRDKAIMTKDDARRYYREHLEGLAESVRQEKALVEMGIEVDMQYIAPSLHSLYDMLIRYDQFGDEVVDEGLCYKRSSQVIKCKTMIPKDILHVYNPERVMIAGLFIATEVYFMTADAISSASTGRRGCIENPELHGLPPTSLVSYGTRFKLNEDTYIALASDTWLSDYVKYTYHMEYPTLSLSEVGTLESMKSKKDSEC